MSKKEQPIVATAVACKHWVSHRYLENRVLSNRVLIAALEILLTTNYIPIHLMTRRIVLWVTIIMEAGESQMPATRLSVSKNLMILQVSQRLPRCKDAAQTDLRPHFLRISLMIILVTHSRMRLLKNLSHLSSQSRQIKEFREKWTLTVSEVHAKTLKPLFTSKVRNSSDFLSKRK